MKIENILTLINNESWLQLLIIVLLFGIPVFLKIYKEFFELKYTRRKFHLDTLDKLIDEMSEDIYNDIYIREKKSLFFSYVVGKEIFSSKMRYILLKLLSKEILTKKDIQRYSHYFKYKNEKIHIEISFWDYVERIYYWIGASIIIVMTILSIIQIKEMHIDDFLTIIVLLFMSMLLIAFSSKISKLKMIIKKLKDAGYYI